MFSVCQSWYVANVSFGTETDMLTTLHVRDFAIIDSLEVELGPGLNVVTGETGAGKSILVDALSLVLGAKADPQIVRTGAEQAEVEAHIVLNGDPALRARLEAAEIPVDDELVIRRVVSATGRSRAFVNGRLVTARELSEIACGMTDISSQHEHHSLTDPAAHLAHLDAFAKLGELTTRMTFAYERAREAHEALHGDALDPRRRAEREDLLRYQVREIDDAGLGGCDEEGMRAECERLRHAEKLLRLTGTAEDALYSGDDAVATQLSRVAGHLDGAADIDPKLGVFSEELATIRAQVEELARSIGQYTRGISNDNERLEELENTLDRLSRLKRKYGSTTEEILAFRARAAEELDELTMWDARRVERENALHKSLAEAESIARELSDTRKRAAVALGRGISEELQSLGMGGSLIEVSVSPLEGRQGELMAAGARLSPTGIDRVEMLIAPNRGEDPKPLRKIASGGELSRALLAIKRVLGKLGHGGLYVFDEVDTGVGGAVAEVIGKKLKEVAQHHQVLCITHLPQIAVYADKHFRVAKEFEDGRTRSTLVALKANERKEEVARMIGGLTITAKTRAAAGEMLRLAH